MDQVPHIITASHAGWHYEGNGLGPANYLDAMRLDNGLIVVNIVLGFASTHVREKLNL
jgi:hypothetical protein